MKLRGANNDLIENELNSLQEEKDKINQQKKIYYLDLLKIKSLRRALVVSLV